jgi:hypothetical protein
MKRASVLQQRRLDSMQFLSRPNTMRQIGICLLCLLWVMVSTPLLFAGEAGQSKSSQASGKDWRS